MSSALAIKVRRGDIDIDARTRMLAEFNRLAAESFSVFPVTGYHFRIAAHFVDQHELGLRAGDALHMAVASEQGATLVTRDKMLADAGPALDAPTQLFA